MRNPEAVTSDSDFAGKVHEPRRVNASCATLYTQLNVVIKLGNSSRNRSFDGYFIRSTDNNVDNTAWFILFIETSMGLIWTNNHSPADERLGVISLLQHIKVNSPSVFAEKNELFFCFIIALGDLEIIKEMSKLPEFRSAVRNKEFVQKIYAYVAVAVKEPGEVAAWALENATEFKFDPNEKSFPGFVSKNDFWWLLHIPYTQQLKLRAAFNAKQRFFSAGVSAHDAAESLIEWYKEIPWQVIQLVQNILDRRILNSSMRIKSLLEENKRVLDEAYGTTAELGEEKSGAIPEDDEPVPEKKYTPKHKQAAVMFFSQVILHRNPHEFIAGLVASPFTVKETTELHAPLINIFNAAAFFDFDNKIQSLFHYAKWFLYVHKINYPTLQEQDAWLALMNINLDLSIKCAIACLRQAEPKPATGAFAAIRRPTPPTAEETQIADSARHFFLTVLMMKYKKQCVMHAILLNDKRDLFTTQTWIPQQLNAAVKQLASPSLFLLSICDVLEMPEQKKDTRRKPMVPDKPAQKIDRDSLPATGIFEPSAAASPAASVFRKPKVEQLIQTNEVRVVSNILREIILVEFADFAALADYLRSKQPELRADELSQLENRLVNCLCDQNLIRHLIIENNSLICVRLLAYLALPKYLDDIRLLKIAVAVIDSILTIEETKKYADKSLLIALRPHYMAVMTTLRARQGIVKPPEYAELYEMLHAEIRQSTMPTETELKETPNADSQGDQAAGMRMGGRR